MFSGILVKVLGGALILSLLAGGITSGVLYVQKVRMERQRDTAITERDVAQAKLAVAEKTIKIFREWENIDEVMEKSDDDDVIDYLRTGVWPQDRSKAGDRPAAVPAPAEAGKPGEGQKR